MIHDRAEARGGIASETKPRLAAYDLRDCDVAAHFGLPGRLALQRGRAWTFMPADLAGQDAPRQRTFSRTLGGGNRPYTKEIIRS
eukprot:scaffold107047_cov24-Phaeocystis_antarctica.AAC.1